LTAACGRSVALRGTNRLRSIIGPAAPSCPLVTSGRRNPAGGASATSVPLSMVRTAWIAATGILPVASPRSPAPHVDPARRQEPCRPHRGGVLLPSCVGPVAGCRSRAGPQSAPSGVVRIGRQVGRCWPSGGLVAGLAGRPRQVGRIAAGGCVARGLGDVLYDTRRTTPGRRGCGCRQSACLEGRKAI